MISLVRNEGGPYRDPDEIRALIRGSQPYYLVDVRTREEYDDGFIPTARWIPWEEVATNPPTQQRDALIILYCYSGVRSESARVALRRAGYTRVFNFGGIINWPDELVIGSGPGNAGE